VNPADQAGQADQPGQGARVAGFYQLCRVADQRDFYQKRAGEYEAANTQLTRVSTGLLVIALAAGLLGIPQWLISRTAAGIVAAVCSALVAAIAGWGTLIGFQQNAKLFRGAAAALTELGGHLDDDPATLPATVTRVEEILQSETGQWGRQLTSSDAQPGGQPQLPLEEGPA
jgi:hypothetical protein